MPDPRQGVVTPVHPSPTILQQLNHQPLSSGGLDISGLGRFDDITHNPVKDMELPDDQVWGEQYTDEELLNFGCQHDAKLLKDQRRFDADHLKLEMNLIEANKNLSIAEDELKRLKGKMEEDALSYASKINMMDEGAKLSAAKVRKMEEDAQSTETRTRRMGEDGELTAAKIKELDLDLRELPRFDLNAWNDVDWIYRVDLNAWNDVDWIYFNISNAHVSLEQQFQASKPLCRSPATPTQMHQPLASEF